MRVRPKTRLGDLLEAFPDMETAFEANDIELGGAEDETTLLQLCGLLEIAYEDLQAVILEALGGELDPDQDELDDFDGDDDEDEETDRLDGLRVPGYDEDEEDEEDDDDDDVYDDDDDDDDLGDDIDEDDLFGDF